MIPLLVRVCPFFFSFLSLHFFILSLSLLLVVPVAPRYGRLTGGGVVMMNPHAAATRSCGRTAAFSGSHFHFHSHSQFQSHIPVLYLYSHRFTNSYTYTFTSLRSHSHSLTRTIVPFRSCYLCSRRAPLFSCCTHCTSRPHAPAFYSTSGVAAFPPLVCRLADCVFLILM